MEKILKHFVNTSKGWTIVNMTTGSLRDELLAIDNRLNDLGIRLRSAVYLIGQREKEIEGLNHANKDLRNKLIEIRQGEK